MNGLISYIIILQYFILYNIFMLEFKINSILQCYSKLYTIMKTLIKN